MRVSPRNMNRLGFVVVSDERRARLESRNTNGKSIDLQQLQLELNALYLFIKSRSLQERVYEDRCLPVGHAQS